MQTKDSQMDPLVCNRADACVLTFVFPVESDILLKDVPARLRLVDIIMYFLFFRNRPRLLYVLNMILACLQ